MDEQAKQDTHTLQVWPSGRGYEYRGDPNGPAEQRQLRAPKGWRDGQPDEWREILHSVRALMYQERDVLCCDSMLVDDLLKAAPEISNMTQSTGAAALGDAFSTDEIRNLYPDPDSMDDNECKEWLTDHGYELPSAICQTSCEHCDLDVEGTIGGDDWRDRGNNTRCNDDAHAHAPTDAESVQDGYLDALCEAVRDADPEPAEVMEWWRITSWLCDQLHAIGEVTIDNGYGQWWGRQATGQQYIMDGVLQQVAARFD